MVKRLLALFNKEISGLHEAAYLLGAFALLSQILALVRDKLLAYSFGAGSTLDVYYASFRLPDLIFASIGSLVSASILLPYFIERFEAGPKEGRDFADSIFTIFFVLIIIASGAVFILAPQILPRLIPGFSGSESLPNLILCTRILLLSPFFLGLSNLYSSLTQMHHRFLVYAGSPVVYNGGIILGVVFGYPLFGVAGLAMGVILGAFFHMAIQLPFISREKLLPRLTGRIDWVRMKKVAKTSLPRTVTLSANQLASFVLVSIASLMAIGSISVFNFSFNLQSVPLTIIGASYSSAVFPALTRLFYKKDLKEFLNKMITSAQHIIFWSMPLTVLFIVLRAQIVRTVLGAGKFDWADTRLTAAMLALFTISTIGQSLIVLFVRAFYAEGKTARPLVINAVSASVIVIMAFVLWKLFETFEMFRYFLEDLFKVSGQAGTSVLVLALAYTVGVLLNTYLHWRAFEKSYNGFTRPVLATLFHSFSAAVIMGYVAFLCLRPFAVVFPLTKVWGVFMQGFCAGIIGLAAGVLILYLLKNKELDEVWGTLRRKVWRVALPPAETETI